MSDYSIVCMFSANWKGDGDDGYMLCGNASGAQQCPDDYVCLGDIGENPRWGFVSFDHFGWAMLTSFQLMTLDFWEDTYNKVGGLGRLGF